MLGHYLIIIACTIIVYAAQSSQEDFTVDTPKNRERYISREPISVIRATLQPV